MEQVVPIQDDLNAQLLDRLPDLLDFIDNARATGAVLVHCEVDPVYESAASECHICRRECRGHLV